MPRSQTGHKTRVIVADDSKPMREKIVQMLQPNYEVIGTAGDGNAALEMIVLLEPEIAILDISMPILTGIEVATEVIKKKSEAKIVILTVHEDSDFVRASMNAGALCYVIKSELAKDLFPALAAALEGQRFISPNCPVTDRMSEFS
jgi:DNA-binding NarL/FixJ family response regulator